MNNFDYKNMTPFKWFVLENFPFIENDFEAINDYRLFSKVVEYLNKTIDNVNVLGQLVEQFSDYFDNLDVQEEINNKLDVMATDGTLENIINQEIFGNINNAIDLINSEKTVLIGDSYIMGANPNNDTLTTWGDIFKNLMGLDNNNCNIIGEAGAGFLRAGIYNHTFLELLQSQINTISNKNYVKNVILCGGYNDNEYTLTNIRNAIVSFVNYCYTQFPNATVYIGCIGYRREVTQSAQTIRRNLATVVYPAYANNVSSNLLTKPYVYLNGVENILKSLPATYMYDNNAHPNQAGQNVLGQGIYQAFRTGKVEPYSSGAITLTNSDATQITANPSFKHCSNCFTIQIPSIEIKFAEETAFALEVGGLTVIANYSCNGFLGGISNENNVISGIASIQDYEKGRHTVPCVVMFDHSGYLRLFTWLTDTSSASGSSYQLTKVKQINIFRCQQTMPDLLS